MLKKSGKIFDQAVEDATKRIKKFQASLTKRPIVINKKPNDNTEKPRDNEENKNQ